MTADEFVPFDSKMPRSAKEKLAEINKLQFQISQLQSELESMLDQIEKEAQTIKN